jgi:hypothetical protein
VLNDVGFTRHYASKVGGAKAPKWINWVLVVFVDVLLWTYNDLNKKFLTAEFVIDWLTELITSKYCLISDFGVYCENNLELKASTIRSKVQALRTVFKWAVLFRNQTGCQFFLHPGDLAGVLTILATINAGMGKQLNVERNRQTIEHLIWAGLSPENGLRDCDRAISSAQLWIDDLIRRGPIPHIDERTHSRLLGFIVALIHIKSPTGRSQGLADLRTHQINELLSEHVVMTDQFKTQLQYHYMPIIAEDAGVRSVIGFFLEHVRPYIATTASEDFLFIYGTFNNCFIWHSFFLISYHYYSKRVPCEIGGDQQGLQKFL